MAAVTVIATALQGSKNGQFVVPAGTPAHIRFDMVSPDFPTNPALTFAVDATESFDGGATFTPYFASALNGGTEGLPGKFGAPMSGLWWLTIQWDGLARLLQITITVNTTFTWGLTATITAT